MIKIGGIPYLSIYVTNLYNHEISLKIRNIFGTFHNVPALTSLLIILYTYARETRNQLYMIKLYMIMKVRGGYSKQNYQVLTKNEKVRLRK